MKTPKSTLDLILDTNALIDATSFYGVEEAQNGGDIGELRYRLARLGAGTLFMWSCKVNGVGVGSAVEISRIITLINGRFSDESDSAIFGMFFAHFVMEFMLPPFAFNLLDGIPASLRGEEVDDALLAAALDSGVGLVTNEGWRQDGIHDGELRDKAQEAGVPVWTTLEWIQENVVSCEALVADFRQTFLAKMPDWLNSRPKEWHGDQAEGSLLNMLSYLESSMESVFPA